MVIFSNFPAQKWYVYLEPKVVYFGGKSVLFFMLEECV